VSELKVKPMVFIVGITFHSDIRAALSEKLCLSAPIVHSDRQGQLIKIADLPHETKFLLREVLGASTHFTKHFYNSHDGIIPISL